MTEQERRDLTQEEAEKIHELVTRLDANLEELATKFPEAFGSGLLSLAIFVVEKVYMCCPDMHMAAGMLSKAQEVGLDNWVADAERERAKAEESQIIIPN